MFENQIATAKRLIAKYGQDVVWHKAVATQNGAKPWNTDAVAPSTFPVKMVFTSHGSGLAQALIHMFKGTDVPTGAPRGLMAAVVGFTPEPTDTIVRGTETLLISSIDVIEPNGVPILYTINFA